MRLDGSTVIGSQLKISIHAPLTGCDNLGRSAMYSLSDFNPRTPYGMRLNNHNPSI